MRISQDAGTLNQPGRTRTTGKTRMARGTTRTERIEKTRIRRIVRTSKRGRWRAERSEYPNINIYFLMHE